MMTNAKCSKQPRPVCWFRSGKNSSRGRSMQRRPFGTRNTRIMERFETQVAKASVTIDFSLGENIVEVLAKALGAQIS